MIVVTPAGDTIDLGTVEATPTIGIIDYSRRITDDFGVTTVVPRGFARRMSVRLAVPSGDVDALQRTLADLRAVAATWIADARFQSLTVRGFFKDFSIDIANGSISYCTLTVEGLTVTEPITDTEADPAPEGKASTLRLLDPITMTDAALVSASVPETDHPEWASGTSYGMGARVIKSAMHRIYESTINANIGNNPATLGSSQWLDVGPTNRWAAFDQALGTATTSSDQVVYTINGPITAVALLDVSADAVRVIADGYDRTQPAGPGAVTFLDLPAGTTRVTVALTGGQVAVGTLLVGRLVGLGMTEASPTAGITDYSRKETDDFGETAVVERAWAKRMSARALLRTDAIDDVVARLATVRARPVLWLGREGQDSLTVYGFFKDFSVEAGQTVSKLSLTIEGLSKAAPLPKPFGEGASVVAQGSVDGVTWHIGLLTGDIFMRISNDSGVNYGPAVRIAGEDGAAGEDGSYQQQIFKRSPTRPPTPTGGGIPAGWSDGVPDGTDLIWLSVQYQRFGMALGPWSLPAQIKGDRGEDGQNAPLVLVQWSVDGSTGWHFEYQEGDKFQRQSNDNGETWGPAVRVVGESAQSGVDGISPSIVFIRSATVPATPAQDTGNPPPGWSDAPPVGTALLWQSVSKFRGGMQLEGWSAPIRISGADGASAFTLVGNTGLALSIEPNRVTKVANSEEFQPEAVFRTAEIFANGCQLSFYPGANSGPYFDFGLWDADRPDAGGTGGIHADWTWHVVPNGNANDLQIFNRDTLKGTYGKVAGQSLGMAYDDRYVVATVNGAEVARFDIGAGRRFYARGAIRGNAHPISRIAWAKAGARGTDGLDGKDGLDGTNGKSIHIAYADSADGRTNFTTGAAAGRAYIGVYTDANPGADSTDPAAYGWTLIRGTDGKNGLNGPGGYVHIAYADSADGKTNFHLSDPTGRRYIGTYTDQTEPDSTNPAVYAWQLVKGADGADGKDGVSIITSPTAFTIPSYSNGATKPEWTGGSCRIALIKGGQEVAADGYTYVNAQNIASISMSGQSVTFADIIGNRGEFTARAVRGGVSFDQRVTITRPLDGSDAFRATATFAGSINSATGTGSATVPAGRLVTVSASATYDAQQNGEGRGVLAIYWANASTGGPMNYLGQMTGSSATNLNIGTIENPVYERKPGSVSVSGQFVSPSPDSQVTYQAVFTTDLGTTVNIAGTISLGVSQ